MASSESSHQVVTIFLVANIHCPTCVTSIKDAVGELDDVRHVWPNIITSCVTVEHSPDLPIEQIISKLDTVGFEVSGVFSGTTFDSNDLPHDNLPSFNSLKSPGNCHCEQCRVASIDGTSTTGKETLDASHTNSAPSDTIAPTYLSFISNNDADAPKSWTASLVISGMTCAACSNTITSELEKKAWIVKATVNLVSNTAVVEYLGEKEDISRVIESIDDLGYGAQLDQVNATNRAKGSENISQRTVQIHIDGFHCSNCGDRAVSGLACFQRDLRIDKHPTLKTPILEVTYVPEAPIFTIRHILTAIDSSDPAFTASIHHPPTLEERAKKIQAQHQKQIFLRVLLVIILAIPTFIIGIVYMSLLPRQNPGAQYLMRPWVSGINRAQIILFILATPVYLCAADVFHRRTIKEIWHLWRPGSQTSISRRLYRFGSMDMLITLGTTIAYISSIAQMIAAAARNVHMINDGSFYFDSVVFLTLFLLIGRFLEAYSKSKTGNVVEALGKLRPMTAILAGKTSNHVIASDLLEFGDIVRVPYGASPPCDGDVIQGSTVFSEASLTGESRHVKKNVRDKVYSGTINQGSSILVRVTGISGRSMLDQIVKVAREGQTKRAPSEKIADTIVAYFVPVVTLLAITTWVVWLIIGLTDHQLAIKEPVSFSLQFAIAVFVVACPCGLALAAPTAIFVGGGLAATHGILVKGGGEAFEMARSIDCIVFDKTGTLTVGDEPSVTDYERYPEEEKGEHHDRVLAAIQAVEENSSHPIAKAVVNYCKTKTSVATTVSNVEEIPGKGVKASCDGESFDILVGNEALMKDHSVDIPPTVAESLGTWKTQAKSVALIAVKPNSMADAEAKYTLSSALSISDPIRPESIPLVKSLRARGYDIWMLSGDNDVTAKAVALQVGIPGDNVIAELLPAQKSDKIKYLQSILKARHGDKHEDVSRRAVVAMVGDGVNDAPALSAADVGIAIGSGSDVAVSSADFVLLSSNLASVNMLLEISRAVFRRIQFNFAWALVYNVIAVPLAAGCLYAIKVHGSHVTLNPVWASLAMALSSLSVVMSSLALRTWIPWIGFRPRHG
ncbi:heavy metal translocating P-type ATPase [Xylaria sp. CBS 124048]|nr:heavy metal translocating P-type ATPase [Xylaria sp. CBS 124048]